MYTLLTHTQSLLTHSALCDLSCKEGSSMHATASHEFQCIDIDIDMYRYTIVQVPCTFITDLCRHVAILYYNMPSDIDIEFHVWDLPSPRPRPPKLQSELIYSGNLHDCTVQYIVLHTSLRACRTEYTSIGTVYISQEAECRCSTFFTLTSQIPTYTRTL